MFAFLKNHSDIKPVLKISSTFVCCDFRTGSSRRDKHHVHSARVLELRRLRSARPLRAGGIQHVPDHHSGQQHLPSHSVSWTASRSRFPSCFSERECHYSRLALLETQISLLGLLTGNHTCTVVVQC